MGVFIFKLMGMALKSPTEGRTGRENWCAGRNLR